MATVKELEDQVALLQQQLAVTQAKLDSKSKVYDEKVKANNALVAENADMKARLKTHEDSEEWKAQHKTDMEKQKADGLKLAADAQKELDKLEG